jgi:hypothetical protein
VLAILAFAVLFGMNLHQRRSQSAEGGDEDHELPGPGVFVPQPVKEA